MKTRLEILKEVANKGIGHNSKRPKPNQLEKAEKFFEKHDQQNNNAEKMMYEFNGYGSQFDGYTAELVHTAIIRWRDQPTS